MNDPLPIPDEVPVELAGKWVAWDDEALHIVASGDTVDETRMNARKAGVLDPYLEFTPSAGMGFIGCSGYSCPSAVRS